MMLTELQADKGPVRWLKEIFTVGELNQAVSHLLEDSIPLLWVRGEISNFTPAASGHWYFTLKESGAAVRAVMFRGYAMTVAGMPKVGDRVEVRARVSLYAPRGDYQLQVENMRRAGVGDLFEAFLRLKEKLAAEGLLRPERKRTPRILPRAIGVVTSLHAAALRDVLSALARRAPQVQIIVYPAAVQGALAAPQLIAALAAANQRAEVDTVLLVRGGGSIEDLWSFNDEALARAVAASHLPVISGIGHETDFTLIDFVADVRAPTPTAAAELACIARVDLAQQLMQHARALVRAQERRFAQMAQRVDRLALQLTSPTQRLAYQKARLDTLSHRLQQNWRTRLSRRQDHLQALTVHLRALNPQHILARGYAVVRRAEGTVIRQATVLTPGETVMALFAEGSAALTVMQTQASSEAATV